MLKSRVRAFSLLSLLVASLTGANDIFVLAPKKHRGSDASSSKVASLFVLRGGGGGGKRRRKRFAWELDAEAMANDYIWEGVPAWGADEDEQRHARLEVRLKGLRDLASRRPGAQAHGVQEGKLRSVVQPTATCTAPLVSSCDAEGSDSAEVAGRDREWTAGLEEGLEGVGGGKSVFHDPDQFSIWRKGWMARHTDDADVNIRTEGSEHGQFESMDSSSDACGHSDTPAGRRPQSAPRCRKGEMKKDGYTGLPLGDRLLALELLRSGCSEAAHEFGLYGIAWNRNGGRNASADSQCAMSLFGHVPLREKDGCAAATLAQRAALNSPHIVEGRSLPAVQNLRVAWQKGGMLLVVWQWSCSTDEWVHRCNETERAASKAGQHLHPLRPLYCQVLFDGEVMPSRCVDVLFKQEHTPPPESQQQQQASPSNQSSKISDVGDASWSRGYLGGGGVLGGSGIWFANTLAGTHHVSVRAASHAETLASDSSVIYGAWSTEIVVQVPFSDLHSPTRAFRRQGNMCSDRRGGGMASETRSGRGSSQVYRPGLAEKWVSSFVGDVLLDSLERQALDEAMRMMQAVNLSLSWSAGFARFGGEEEQVHSASSPCSSRALHPHPVWMAPQMREDEERTNACWLS